MKTTVLMIFALMLAVHVGAAQAADNTDAATNKLCVSAAGVLSLKLDLEFDVSDIKRDKNFPKKMRERLEKELRKLLENATPDIEVAKEPMKDAPKTKADDEPKKLIEKRPVRKQSGCFKNVDYTYVDARGIKVRIVGVQSTS